MAKIKERSETHDNGMSTFNFKILKEKYTIRYDCTEIFPLDFI
jgi:hypothetical protein